MRPELMRDTVTFKRSADQGQTYTDILTCRAYINGVSGDEFFIANAGFAGGLTVTVTCRWQPGLMAINPTNSKIVDGRGNEYELLSPADDKQGKHVEVIFRARRVMLDE